MDVEERLRDVEERVAVLVERIDSYRVSQSEMLSRLDDTITELTRAIRGYNGTVGLGVRTDRLEETVARWSRNVQATWAAVAAISAKVLVDLFHVGGAR